MAYDIDGIINATDLGSMYYAVNNEVSQTLGVSMIISVVVIIFGLARLTTGETSKRLLASSFITAIVSLGFRMLSLVSDRIMWGTIILCAIMMFLAVLMDR